jgi:hypothetical protein
VGSPELANVLFVAGVFENGDKPGRRGHG